MLFVTHFLDQVYEVCDRITVLRNGRLVGEYTPTVLPKLELVEKMIGKELGVLEQLDEQPKRSLAAIESSQPVAEATDLGRRGAVAPFQPEHPRKARWSAWPACSAPGVRKWPACSSARTGPTTGSCMWTVRQSR